MGKLTCLKENSSFSAQRRDGGVSGLRGLSEPISEPLLSESCIFSAEWADAEADGDDGAA